MLYVFVGARDQRMRDAVQVALGHPAPDDLAYTHLDGQQSDVDVVAAACGTIAMFGGRRKVFFENAQLRTGRGNKLLPWLRAFAKDRARSATCDLAVAAYLDLGDSRTRGRAKPFMDLKQGGAQVREFRPLRGDEAIRFIQHRAHEHGVAVTDDAAARLTETVTPDAGILSSEVDKLAAYAGFSGTVDIDDVDAASATIGEHTRWEYINAVTDRRLDRALHVLHDMLALKAPPVMVLADVITSLRRVTAAKGAMAAGVAAADVGRATGMPAFMARQSARQASQMSHALLRRLYAELARTDLALKSTGGDSDALLEILTSRLTARPSKSASR